MIKRNLVALAIIMTPQIAIAGDTYVVRDERGRRVGSIEESPSGALVQRDNRGRRLGAIEKEQSADRRWALRDTRGRRTGALELPPGDVIDDQCREEE